MIIFGSIVTILAVVIGLGILLFIAKKIFDLYIDLIEPYVINALNNIEEILFKC